MESEWTPLGLHFDSGGIPLGLLGLLGLHSDSTGIHLDSEQSNQSPMGRVGECKVQPPTVKTMTQTGLDLDLVETIDLTMSSSPATEEDSMIVEDEPFCTSSNVVSGSSSPVEYGSEDEEEVSCYYFYQIYND